MNGKMLGVVLPGLFGLMMAMSGCEGHDGELESDLNAAELRGGNGNASGARCGCNKPTDDDADSDEDVAVDEQSVDGGTGKGQGKSKGKGKDKDKGQGKEKDEAGDDAGVRGKSDQAKARRDGGSDCICDDADSDSDGGVAPGKSGDKGGRGDHGKPDAGARGNGKAPTEPRGQGRI
ncbi:MAG: hypothetical protein ABW252_23470 [Polyangiales bacterium]